MPTQFSVSLRTHTKDKQNVPMDETPRIKLSLRTTILKWTVSALTTAVALMSFAAFFGQIHPSLDMLSHFRLLYIGALSLLCMTLYLLKNRILLLMGLVALAVSSIPVVSMYFPVNKTNSTDAHKIRLLQINPQADKNHQTDKVIDYALQIDPEILAITELSKEWKVALKNKLGSYPYQLIEGRFDTGIAIFSKLPIEEHHVRYYPGVPIEHPQIECRMKIGNQPITVIFAHTTPPKKLVASRNAEMQSIAELASRSNIPVLVFGDLNCGPWSYHFKQLESNGRLTDSEQGFGPQPSWTTEMIFPLVPIDHVLTSKEFATLRRSTGPNIGSDHLPVYVELSLAPSRQIEKR